MDGSITDDADFVTVNDFEITEEIEEYAVVGDLRPHSYVPPKNLKQIEEYCYDKLSNTVQRAHLRGTIPLILGGDHSIAIGTLDAATKILGKPPFVLYNDAHMDINPPYASPSGNVHGMPLYLALDKGNLQLDQLAFVGTRAPDEWEKKFVKDNKIPVYDMKKFTHLGPLATAQEIAKKANGRPVHISFDVDVLDKDVVPDTGTPAAGGISKEDMREFFGKIGKLCNVCSVEVAELNPGLVYARGTASGDNLSTKNTLEVLMPLFDAMSHNQYTEKKGIDIISAPEYRGQRYPGVAKGGDALLKENLRGRLEALGYSVEYTEVPVFENVHRQNLKSVKNNTPDQALGR